MEIADVLGPEGLLSRTVDGFAHRDQQQAMAEAVADCLEQGNRLIAEAGTGTGKTFAYLVPALLAGKKVIISTGTRNLQDQLFLRDLPRLRDAMASPARAALLKGRANYLCRYRLDLAWQDPRRGSPDMRNRLPLVRDWAAATGSTTALTVLSSATVSLALSGLSQKSASPIKRSPCRTLFLSNPATTSGASSPHSAGSWARRGRAWWARSGCRARRCR